MSSGSRGSPTELGIVKESGVSKEVEGHGGRHWGSWRRLRFVEGVRLRSGSVLLVGLESQWGSGVTEGAETGAKSLGPRAFLRVGFI